VVDSASPVTEFTDKDTLKAYLKRQRGAFNRPLVYRIKDGHEPVIMTVSRVLAGGQTPNQSTIARDIEVIPPPGRSAHFNAAGVTPVTPEH
jgi:hypothetical protein